MPRPLHLAQGAFLKPGWVSLSLLCFPSTSLALSYGGVRRLVIWQIRSMGVVVWVYSWVYYAAPGSPLLGAAPGGASINPRLLSPIHAGLVATGGLELPAPEA